MKKELDTELQKLHQDLQDIQSLDQESIQKLQRLRDDIDKVMAADVSAGATEQEHGALKKSLQHMVDHFEETHPKLIATANRAIQILGQMGISG